ncbi:MAG: SHOCT domain-containing protein [Actinomycetia bacterium]|nr:SHOCT domain-containing protein [Actinomycetes bacterium]
MNPAGLILLLAIFSTLWGFVGKAMAVAKNLDERSGFWLGFILWFVGLIIIAVTPSRQSVRGAVDGAGESATTAQDRLRRLVSMHVDGLISDDEFQSRRTAILDEL